MLSKEENERITRVGPGTPMGALLRRYWMPACLSEELAEPDGEPLKVKLLGEQLVAYRDTNGQVGLLSEFCPHRRASMWLGRNEEAGLRCVFHGWKFDHTGACVDMPTEPPETNFAHKVQIRAYPTAEVGGIVWAYMGPTEKQPPLPNFEWASVPETHRHVGKMWEECNWLQALEGGVDSAHSSYLHRALGDAVVRGGFASYGYRARGHAPKLEVRLQPWGYTYASIRQLGEEGDYVRSYQYVMPFTQLRAQQFGARAERTNGIQPRPLIGGHMWVPMDDENTMVYNMLYHYGPQPLLDGEEIETNSGRGKGDHDASFRKWLNKDNNWKIDRQAQKTRTYTGIDGLNTQDHAVQESMGPISDRSEEHLGTIDKAVIATRRLLLEAMKTVEDGGDPPGADDSYYRCRAIERLLPAGSDWWAEMEPDILEQRPVHFEVAELATF